MLLSMHFTVTLLTCLKPQKIVYPVKTNNSSLSIPDRTYDYTEYRNGLVTDDFRYIEVARIVHEHENN